MEILTQNQKMIVKNYDLLFLETITQFDGMTQIMAKVSNPDMGDIVLGEYNNEEQAQKVIKLMARHIGLGLKMFRMPKM